MLSAGPAVIHTYHLTRFGTAASEGGAPPPLYHTCSARIGTPDLGANASPGGRSAPVRQALVNSGSPPFAGVLLDATPWHVDGGGGGPQGANRPSLPASATEVSEEGIGGGYAAVDSGAAVAVGLGGGEAAHLWFRLDLAPYGEAHANGTLVQRTAYWSNAAPGSRAARQRAAGRRVGWGQIPAGCALTSGPV